jgi:nuclear pore complex protein Nup85
MEGDEEEYVHYMDNFRRLLDILAGDEAAVLDEAGEWRTALGAWGLYVRPGLRRDNLP